MVLVIVFLLVGLGMLAATDTTKNTTNIKKNTDNTHIQTIKDTTKAPTTEKQIQKTIKNENKKQDTEPINIADYADLERELNDDTTPEKH